MTAKAALCKALLDGHVLSIMSAFRMVGLTNLGREIPRMVEIPFGVEVSRVNKTAKSRYGQSVWYTQYRLNRSEHNAVGIAKMIEYCEREAAKKKEVAAQAKPTPKNQQIKMFDL